MTRIVVVLPAPFGPRKPVTRPGWHRNEMSSTARKPPYDLVSPVTSIMATIQPVAPRGPDRSQGLT